MKIDEKDQSIIHLLKQNASLTSSQISKKTRIPITTIHNRVKRLKESGVIKNFTISIDHEKVGRPLTSYILVTVNQNLSPNKKISQQGIGKKIKILEDVESVEIVTGATDLLVKVRTDTMQNLSNFLTHKLREIDGVDKTQTMMVLEDL